MTNVNNIREHHRYYSTWCENPVVISEIQLCASKLVDFEKLQKRIFYEFSTIQPGTGLPKFSLPSYLQPHPHHPCQVNSPGNRTYWIIQTSHRSRRGLCRPSAYRTWPSVRTLAWVSRYFFVQVCRYFEYRYTGNKCSGTDIWHIISILYLENVAGVLEIF